MDLVLCHGGRGMGQLQTVYTTLGKLNFPNAPVMLKNSHFSSMALPKDSSWITTPNHNPHSTKRSTRRQTMQSDKCRTKTSDFLMEKYHLSLQRARLHFPPVQWQRVSHHLFWPLALHFVKYCLDAATQPRKPIPWSFVYCFWANLKAT